VFKATRNIGAQNVLLMLADYSIYRSKNQARTHLRHFPPTQCFRIALFSLLRI